MFFILGMVGIWPADGGTQWGARYLLPAYPLVAFLAVYAYEKWSDTLHAELKNSFQIIFIGLITTSIIIQIIGVRFLFSTKTIAFRDELKALPVDYVLTNQPLMPSFQTSLQDKTFMYVDNQQDIIKLIPQFVAQGITHIAFVNFQFIPIEIPEQVEDILVQPISPHSL